MIFDWAHAFLLVKFVLFYGLVIVTLLAPGYALLKKLSVFKQEEDNASFGFALSMLLAAGFAMLHFIFGLSFWAIEIIYAIILVFALKYLIQQRVWLYLKTSLAFVAFIVMSATSLCYVALPLTNASGYIPDPHPTPNRNYSVFNVKILNLAHTPANDNYIPFRQAQFFTDRLSINNEPFIGEWNVNFFYRTPLMGAVASFYFDLLHEKPPSNYLWAQSLSFHSHIYEQFQVIGHILNSLFIFPAYIFIKRLFRKKIAALTVLFLVFSPFFLYNTFFSWPKSLVAYFILSSWILLHRRERPVFAGILSGMAYLVHDLSALYLVGSAVFLLLKRSWIYLVKMFSIMLAMALPWLIAARVIYHQSSLFLYYPFSLKEIPSSPSHVISDFFHTPLQTILHYKISALYDLLIHLHPRHWFTGQWRTYFWVDILTTIPGAVSFLLFPFSYFAILKRLRYDWSIIISFVIVPVIALLVLLGSPKALGVSAMHFAEVLVVILTAYAIALLLTLPRWLMGVVFASAVAGYYFMFGFGYNFNFTGWLSASTLPLLLFILACHLFIIYLAACTVLNRAPRHKLLQGLLN